ncbi:MAG: hypothetical protein HOF36_09865 [Candidatus Marinimicrobia bacterium]|jgi:hypothetical protein|nr:hypothetical protein [Candidatus Neomarinimicrobiota bacterium]MBT4994118.1 hypothetical protein [Candidatus Neomarinimicrobiota bacterium]MBT6217922.1 hypothetical protein [Candidatus Neomarinimicrobiota bacterium]
MINKSTAEIKIPKAYIVILNQLYEVEKKISDIDDCQKVFRNIERMKDALRENINTTYSGGVSAGLVYEDPMGEPFDDTRSDLDAHIAGEGTSNLVVIDVIKPIIRFVNPDMGISQVVQRGIVTVEELKNKEEN